MSKVKLITLDVKKISKVPISKSLLKKMSNLKSKDTIEVEIFLNNETDDKDYIGLSGSGFVDFKYKSHISPIQAHKKSAFSDSLKQLSTEEQAKRASDKLSEVRKDLKKNRVELAERLFNNIAVKLHSIKLDYTNFNKSAGILKLKLNKKDIEELSKYPYMIYSIGLSEKNEQDFVSAFNEIRLNTTIYPVSEYGGNDVGIYMNEGGHQCFVESHVTPIENLMGLGGGAYTTDITNNDTHADVDAQALRMSSPESHIYCSDNEFSIPSSYEDNVHIVNYSWSSGGESENPNWHSEDRSADMHAYNDNVQLFISAGNDCNDDNDGNGKIECIVGAPKKSHNAITVGAYNDVTDMMYASSDWNTSKIHPDGHINSDYTKPEILAPGVAITTAGLLNSSFTPPRNEWHGTSFASPIVAGVAASMLSNNENMKNQQALIKAAMIAMASKDDIANNGNSRRDGASAIQWNPYISWHWWDESNSFLDDADGQWMLLDERYLYSGYNVKAVFSWSNRTDRCDGTVSGSSYNGPDDYLCMDLDLKVIDPNGSTKLHGASYSNNFEGGEFYTNTAGYYKFYVKRYSNYYEYTSNWYGKKTYHKNRAKLGLAIAYITSE